MRKPRFASFCQRLRACCSLFEISAHCLTALGLGKAVGMA